MVQASYKFIRSIQKKYFKLPKSFKINAQTVVILQSACKVTYFFTHAQAQDRNIVRFSVAIVCVEGARGTRETRRSR